MHRYVHILCSELEVGSILVHAGILYLQYYITLGILVLLIFRITLSPQLSPYSWNRKFWWGAVSNRGFLFFWPPLLQGGFDECLGSTCGPWSSGWEPLAYTQIFSYVNPSIFNWIKLKSSKMEEWTKYVFKIAWSTVIKLLSWWNRFTVNFV